MGEKQRLKSEIAKYKRKVREIEEELSEQYEHIDDSQWEIPGLKEAEMRKKIYERKVEDLEKQLKS